MTQTQLAQCGKQGCAEEIDALIEGGAVDIVKLLLGGWMLFTVYEMERNFFCPRHKVEMYLVVKTWMAQGENQPQ